MVSRKHNGELHYLLRKILLNDNESLHHTENTKRGKELPPGLLYRLIKRLLQRYEITTKFAFMVDPTVRMNPGEDSRLLIVVPGKVLISGYDSQHPDYQHSQHHTGVIDFAPEIIRALRYSNISIAIANRDTLSDTHWQRSTTTSPLSWMEVILHQVLDEVIAHLNVLAY